MFDMENVVELECKNPRALANMLYGGITGRGSERIVFVNGKESQLFEFLNGRPGRYLAITPGDADGNAMWEWRPTPPPALNAKLMECMEWAGQVDLLTEAQACTPTSWIRSICEDAQEQDVDSLIDAYVNGKLGLFHYRLSYGDDTTVYPVELAENQIAVYAGFVAGNQSWTVVTFSPRW